jgi:hypothetical protein
MSSRRGSEKVLCKLDSPDAVAMLARDLIRATDDDKDSMLNQQRPAEVVAKYLVSNYVQ